MGRYVLRRILQLIPILIGITFLSFAMMRLAGGDAITEMYGNKGAVSQEVIDNLLRLGGCTRKSAQRIYGFYRRANDQAENIEFLKREYETDAIGMIIDDRKVSAKWDENGIRISQGEYVSDEYSAFLPWETVDQRIRELLEMGQYRPQVEAERAVSTNQIWLRAYLDSDGRCRYAYSLDGEQFEPIGERYAVAPGVWIGAKVGIFAISPNVVQGAGYADFDFVHVESQPTAIQK